MEPTIMNLPIPKRRKKDDTTDRLLTAIENINDVEDYSAIKNFFISIAQRAEKLSPAKQSLLQIKCAQLLHEIEFGDT